MINKPSTSTLALVGAMGLALVPAVAAPVGAGVQLSAQQVRNLPAGLSANQALAHDIAPDNIKGIQSDADELPPARLIVPVLPKTFKVTPQLDIAAFGDAMHNALKSQVNGYTLQVRKNGNLSYNLIWNWAKTPADGGKGWTGDSQMHIASVSKFITAVAMVKALDAKGISYDAKIVDYLPTYWSKGNNINKISFRNLLTQTSGFNTGTSSSDYAFMKGKVAAGVPQVGGYDYENMNFGLCRILIPIVNGNVSKNASFFPISNINDQLWDSVTLFNYNQYVQNNIFAPSGVTDGSFAPQGASTAYAYKYSGGGSGWNSGNLASVAGGAGWRLTLNDLMKVMSTVRRKNTILAPSKVQYMLDNYFGIDQIIDTPAGKLYDKNGAWGDGTNKEQCVAYFMPGGIEVGVFVNSNIGAADKSLRGLVKDSYLASLK